jgi:hypothetical protein
MRVGSLKEVILLAGDVSRSWEDSSNSSSLITKNPKERVVRPSVACLLPLILGARGVGLCGEFIVRL